MARPKAQRTVKAVPDETQEVEPVQESAAETVDTVPADPVPTGYVAREIVWPAHFWRVFDKQAARGGLTTSKFLERLLQHLARE